MIGQWFGAVRRSIPQGSRLPDNAKVFRHRKIVWFALASSAAVSLLALFHDQSPAHALVAGTVPALIATAAWKSSLPYRARSSIAAVGLMVTAMAAVHVTGTVEAHFLFFIMVPVIVLYEDWVPVAAALGTVLIHHIVLGMFAPPQLAEYALPRDNHAGQAVLHIRVPQRNHSGCPSRASIVPKQRGEKAVTERCDSHPAWRPGPAGSYTGSSRSLTILRWGSSG